MKNVFYLPALFPVIAVVGPTAAGKTAVAIRIARRIRAEIINLDSIQVYRRLDIGSAKPSLEEQAGVVHHLLDMREPSEPLDAASFARIAGRRADRIIDRGKNVVFAGGTGFYLKALLCGLSEAPGQLAGIRQFLKKTASMYGRERLHHFLKEIDPASAARIHPNDLYRVCRALEVFLSSGHPFSWWRHKKGTPSASFIRQRHCLKIGLNLSRQVLYQRIEKRVDQMIAAGFVREVKGLLEKGLDPRLKPLQSLGYRHIICYLQGSCSLDEAISTMKRDTRRYAKRQLTWFKKDPQIRWFRPDYLLGCPDVWKAVN